jgi:hypothetical protein
MRLLVQTLFDKRRLPSTTADAAKSQYSSLLSAAHGKWNDKFTNFSLAAHRVDTFFAELLNDEASYYDLWVVVKLILIVSHGNASVESGFSVNSGFLVENLREESLVCQRQVHDDVLAAGGILSVPMEKSLLQLARSARSRYRAALEEKKKEINKEDERLNALKHKADIVKVLKAKKLKVMEDARAASMEIERQVAELK